MISDIIKGISKRLDDNFDYDIFCDLVNQGLNPPCFFIKVLRSSKSDVLNNRKYLSHDFVIQFIPNDNDCMNLHDMAEDLYRILQYIFIDVDSNTINCVHSFNTHHEIVDNVLMFYLSFNYYSYESVQSVVNMDSLESDSINISNVFNDFL